MLALSSSCRARFAACRTLDAFPLMPNRQGDKLVTEMVTNWEPDVLTSLDFLSRFFAFGHLCVNACICVRVNASIYREREQRENRARRERERYCEARDISTEQLIVSTLDRYIDVYIYILALTRTHIHAFIQRRPKAKRQTDNDDWSACLVPNLSPFRAPICHHSGLASMGMHPKCCKLRVLPGNLKTLPTWNPCLVRGSIPPREGCKNQSEV